MCKNFAYRQAFPEATCLALIVLLLRQEKYCTAGILSSCASEGDSEIRSSAVLLVAGISPKMLQITQFENVPVCKWKKKGSKRKKKKEKSTSSF